MYMTTAKQLLAAHRMFITNPDTVLSTGMWTDPYWTKEDFHRWFMHCLHAKVNRNDKRTWHKLDVLYQSQLHCDACVIADYTLRHVRSSGSRGMLRTPELQRRFSYINNQSQDG